MDEHIHTPFDGRGRRNVFVNGNPIEYCFYADTKRGIADIFFNPVRLHKTKENVLRKRLRGHVTVKFSERDN